VASSGRIDRLPTSSDNQEMSDASLEIPIDDPRIAVRAAGIATRLEICRALDQDGLTPSVEVVSSIRRSIEAAGIRPPDLAVLFQETAPPPDRRRCGSEVFRLDVEGRRRLRDLAPRYAAEGVSAIVIGLLDEDGEIDFEACAGLVAHHREHGLDTAFHRAFDFTPDPKASLERLSRAGVVRTLSAGAPGLDPAGHSDAARCARLGELAAFGRRLDPPVDIIPCGGIRAHNGEHFLAVTGHLHASCRVAFDDGGGVGFDETEATRLREMVDAVGRG
jgi:copper homeostasis protein